MELGKFAQVTCRRANQNDRDVINVITNRAGENAFNGGYSAIGRRGGSQDLFVNRNLVNSSRSSRRLVNHELMHALGVLHEQSRADRDNFVDVYFENISQGAENNFRKVANRAGYRFTTEYGFDSIMHYTSYSFSKNRRPTILKKGCQPSSPNRNCTIQRATEMTEGDHDILVQLYGVKDDSTQPIDVKPEVPSTIKPITQPTTRPPDLSGRPYCIDIFNEYRGEVILFDNRDRKYDYIASKNWQNGRTCIYANEVTSALREEKIKNGNNVPSDSDINLNGLARRPSCTEAVNRYPQNRIIVDNTNSIYDFISGPNFEKGIICLRARDLNI